VSDRLTILIDDGPNAAARAWAARLVARVAGFPFRVVTAGRGAPVPAGPLVHYGQADTPGITIAPSGFFDGDLSRPALPEKPSAEFDGLPVLFGGGAIDRRSDRTVVSADIFASAFYLASRIEERFAAERDRHGRFPAAASLACKSGLVEQPLVDEYARWLSAEIARLYPRLSRRSPWPGGASFAVCVTHDVEHLKAPSRLGYLKGKVVKAAREAARGDLASAVADSSAGVVRALSGESPSWSFERLRAAVRPWPATFYFFGGATSALDGAYDVESQRIREVIAQMAAEGCEIGLHLGYDTGDDDGLMRAQLSKVQSALGAPVRGERQHYLRAVFPDVWRAHEKAGFAYDASLGFPEAAGFRGGTSYPFQPFDLDSGRELNVFEVPLVAMDGTFFQYQQLSGDEIVARVIALARTVKDAGGVFTLLWHNTTVDPVDRPDLARAYAEVTSALKGMPAWGTTVWGCVEAWKSYCQSLEETRG
jgi:hypothetical protein